MRTTRCYASVGRVGAPTRRSSLCTRCVRMGSSLRRAPPPYPPLAPPLPTLLRHLSSRALAGVPRDLHILHVEQVDLFLVLCFLMVAVLFVFAPETSTSSTSSRPFFFVSHFCNSFFSHFYCYVCFRPRDLHILHVESRTLIPSAIFLFPPHTPTTRRRSPACSSPAFFCVLTLRCSIPRLCARASF